MRLFFILVLLKTAGIAYSQQIAAHIYDARTKEPVAFATVQYGQYKGVVANEEGYFSIPEFLDSRDIIKISSLGYESMEFKAGDFKQSSLLLKPQSISLKDVYLTNKNLKAIEIVQRAKEKVKDNYDFDLSQKRFFFRQSNVNTVKQFDLEVEESTIPEIDQNLMNRISNSVPKVSDSYKEVLGDLYGNYDEQKLQIIRAANLHNPASTAGLEELSKKLEKILQRSVKDNSYLKIKSGIIGVKMDAKEIQEEIKEEKKVVEKTEEEKNKEILNKQNSLRSSVSSNIKGLLKTMFWNEDTTLDLFEKPKKYNFKVDGYTAMDNSTVYIISFKPKRGADFKGKLYINTVDYGVYRLEYENVKPLKKFRLFGISTMDDIYRGKMIFSRDASGKYHPKYIEREKGESAAIDRPLTIIEKNKFVAGRRKQNELDLEVRIKIGQTYKYQLIVYENQPLQQKNYGELKVSGNFDFEIFKVYNPEFWNGYNVMEPNAAIKAFTALEEEDL